MDAVKNLYSTVAAMGEPALPEAGGGPGEARPPAQQHREC